MDNMTCRPDGYKTDRKAPHDPGSEQALSVIRYILKLLTDPRAPVCGNIDAAIRDNPDFISLCANITDIRELTSALGQGNLQMFTYNRGYILSNLKALQSNLRHLTWQTQKIAEGDFSQRVDFLGDFSDSFNSMTIKLRDMSLQLRRLASFDSLTQVPNRLSLEDFLSIEFAAAKENGKKLGVITFDIDHFKEVNDSYGHAAGDSALVWVSAILSGVFRANDLFARYGGEEFVAVLHDTGSREACGIAERALRAVAESPLDIGGISLCLTVSAGVSELSPGDESFDAILGRSDDALYMSKRNGRNRVSVL